MGSIVAPGRDRPRSPSWVVGPGIQDQAGTALSLMRKAQLTPILAHSCMCLLICTHVSCGAIGRGLQVDLGPHPQDGCALSVSARGGLLGHSPERRDWPRPEIPAGHPTYTMYRATALGPQVTLLAGLEYTSGGSAHSLPQVKGGPRPCTHILCLPWHPELALGMGWGERVVGSTLLCPPPKSCPLWMASVSI